MAIRVNILDAKTHLSRYLEQVGRGETILLCKRNVPIAEIRQLPQEASDPRPIGLARGTYEVQASFFEPLLDELVSTLSGEGR